MDNITLIKQVSAKADVGSTNHTRRLLDLEGVRNWERTKIDLLDADFRWYVTARNLNLFKYFAVVRTVQGERNYIGDIPNFAIERAELAISLGIKEITIHSMQPLPVSRVDTDPVMVGWLYIPQKAADNFTYGHYGNWEGVVLAVWDNERELEL